MANVDYSLTGVSASRAVEMGLAEADWYQPPLPRATLRKLLERRDGPAIRDTLLLFAILVSTAFATVVLWGTWWAVIPYLIYAVFYGTSSDSRWHECSHGTAFKTDWMNNLVYEVASFMVMRESVVWRWSHNRHHSDTIIVGRDPEIQIPRPPDIKALVLSLVCYGSYKTHYASVVRHALGSISDAEKSFVPASEHSKVIRNARILATIYTLVVASAIAFQSWLPIFFLILPQFFGTWVMIVQNTPQHAGLAENVLDHRLNCRTIYMNPISQFIYWNMNYHLEHHMFPLVPYHALPKLHEALKEYCPPPYPSMLSAWRELLPAIRRQVDDPGYFIKRELPADKEHVEEGVYGSNDAPNDEGWLTVCNAADLKKEDAIRFDHNKKTFALYRIASGELFATNGVCTHGNTHLGNGLVKGELIECPKHNGRFNLRDGSPARAPICRGLATYEVEERDGRIWLNVERAGGVGARTEKAIKLRVVSNTNVATFIKELVLEPVDAGEQIEFTPGDYIQLNIPEYEQIRFGEFDVPEPYATVWRNQNVYDLTASNFETGRHNNYSLANNVVADRELRFNVRIATPPQGQDCPPGE